MRRFLIIFLFLGISVYAQSLLITEIMYNPEGNDTNREWIEVFNQSNSIFKIKTGRSGWRINDGSNHLFNEPEIDIYPNEIFLIVQDKNTFLKEYLNFSGKIIEANFSLKNESGIIKIFDENKQLMAEASYQNSIGGNGNGYSIALINNNWQESKIKGGTPGYLEKISFINQEEKKRQEKSEATTTSTTSARATPSTTSTISTSSLTFLSTSSTTEAGTETIALSNEPIKKSQKIELIINEFLPNPKGNDEGQEFIEIYNPTNEAIQLDNVFLEINKKKIKLKGLVEPFDYYIINNKGYNFYIRNQGETISLYYQNEKFFSITYEGKAKEGKSFSRFEDGWQWSEPTPGKENIKIVEAQIKENQIKENKQNIIEEVKLKNTSTNLRAEINKTIEEKNQYFIIIIFSLFLIIFLSILAVRIIK